MRRFNFVLFAVLLPWVHFSSQTAPPPTSIVMAFESSGTVMYVGAQPEDETSIAAFLARAVGDGKKLYVVSLTRGENEPAVPSGPRGSGLGRERAKWLQESAELIGGEVVQLEFVNGPFSVKELDEGAQGDWPPGTTTERVIDYWRSSGRDPLEALVRAIRTHKPDLLITWERTRGWTGNPEHRAAAALLDRAFVDAGNRYMFPEHARMGLKPWQPKYLFAAVKDSDSGSGPAPVEEIGCDAPASMGRTACLVKAQVIALYRRHKEQITAPDKVIDMTNETLRHVEGHSEYLQLVREMKESSQPFGIPHHIQGRST